jgi:hypothetical protein
VRFEQVTLATAADVDDFYWRVLGLGAGPFRIGETTLEFVAGEGEPFYHFALLVPGDRFDAALEWARERVDLLPGQEGNEVFDFGFWDAQACYFHDPAGNILELIAHRGVEERGTRGPFEPGELVGVSELGLVGDPPALAAKLEPLGIQVWSGSLDPGSLAFAGERARTFILAPAGRGWLPTGRPAEEHRVEATVAGAVAGTAVGALVRIGSGVT